MTLMRRLPQRPVMPARDPFDWIFQDPWRMFDGDRFGASNMPIDLRESDEAYNVEAELPGVRPEDTEVTLEGRTLTIRAHYDESRQEGEQGDRFLVRERRTGELTRSLTLPSAIDTERVSSAFEQGELHITLPKAPETRARRIPVGPGNGAKRGGSKS